MCRHGRVEPAFTLKLPIDELVKLCEVLVKGTPFCIALLGEVLVANQARFGLVWPSLSQSLSKLIQDGDLQSELIDLLVTVSTHCFDESELWLLSSLIAIADTKHKQQLMAQLRSVLLNHSSGIEQRWADVFASISPSNFEGDPESISSAFALLHLVVSGHFQRLSEGDMQRSLSLLFEFAAQTTVMNTSLSALGLLWEITPFIHQLTRFWKRILSDTLVFFSDARVDVAICALNTFFSLITSNSAHLPAEVFDHLITNCFLPLLMTFTSARPQSWAVHQLALLEMSHCSCGFWPQFAVNTQFVPSFWSLLMEKQEAFMINCDVQEIAVAGIQFYEECFKCAHLDGPLREALIVSFSRVVSHYFSLGAQVSLVLSWIGRLYVSVIPAQKPFLDSKQLHYWIESISTLAVRREVNAKLAHPIQKAAESLSLLFPIDFELGSVIVSTYERIIHQTPNPQLQLAIFDRMKDIFGSGIGQADMRQYLKICKSLLPVPEAKKWVEFLVELNFDVDSGNAAELFEFFDAVGRSIPSVAPTAHRRIVKYVRFLSVNQVLSFITYCKSDVELLIEMWNDACDPQTKVFPSKLFDCYGSALLQAIVSHLASSNDNEVRVVLDFIESSAISAKDLAGNANCVKWHFFGILRDVLPLLNHQNSGIRDGATRLLTDIERQLGTILGESTAKDLYSGQ
jgi:hypothetical protein